MAIEQLLAIGTGLGTVAKTRIDNRKNTCEINDKIRSKNSLYSHSHFTEHPMDMFEKSLQDKDLNHEPSSLLIR
jgi:hypothetical protein